MSRRVIVSARTWFNRSTLSRQTFSPSPLGNLAMVPKAWPHLPGPDRQNARFQNTLSFKQEIVHLPELPLKRRRFGRFSGNQGVGMGLRQRKVSEHKAHLLAERLLQLFDHRIGGAAIRTLI